MSSLGAVYCIGFQTFGVGTQNFLTEWIEHTFFSHSHFLTKMFYYNVK